MTTSNVAHKNQTNKQTNKQINKQTNKQTEFNVTHKECVLSELRKAERLNKMSIEQRKPQHDWYTIDTIQMEYT